MCSLSLREESLHKLFVILLHGRLFSSWFVYLYQYGLKDIYFIVGYNSIELLSFLVPVVPLLATGGSFSWPLWPFGRHTPIIVCFCLFFLFILFSISLLSGTTRCSSLISYISCLHSRIFCFSKKPCFFLNWRMELETKTWVQMPLLQLRCACF